MLSLLKHVPPSLIGVNPSLADFLKRWWSLWSLWLAPCSTQCRVAKA